MTYDFWVGRRATARRHALHAAGDLPLVARQLPLRRRPRSRGRPVLVGPAEEAGDLHLEQPHRAAGDGRGHARRRVPCACRRRAGAMRPNSGPVGIGPFNYELSEQSMRVREAANAAMKGVVERAGLGRFMKLTEPHARTRPIRSAAAGWRSRATSASSTTAARCSATRACSASTPRRSRPRWA